MERDIIERLMDFENAGITSSDRYRLRTEAAFEIGRLRRLLDPAVCRLQFPDGSVPGNTKEAAEGWKQWADRYHDELIRVQRYATQSGAS